MRGAIDVPYLERRVKRAKRTGKVTVYWYWRPKGKAVAVHGMRTTRLVAKPPKGASADDIRLLAIKEAQALNAELARKQGGELDPASIEGTLPWLVRELRNAPKYQALKPSTKSRTYECWFPLLIKWSQNNDHPDVRRLTRPVVQRLYEEIVAPDPDTGDRQLAKGKNVIATLRRLLRYGGVILDGVDESVAQKLEMIMPKPRWTIWTKDQIATVTQAALKRERRSLALATQLAYNLGQRRADLVDLRRHQWDGAAFLFRQSKTDAFIRVPATRQLRVMIEDLLADRPMGPDDHFLICERTGKPYTGDSFHGDFSALVAGVGYEDLWFHDLRRTCVVRLARAGLTVPQISAVTGHTPQSAHGILRHYLPRDAEVAASGIAQLETFEAAAE